MENNKGGTSGYGVNLNNKGLARGQNRKFLSFTGKNSMMPVASGYEYASGIVIDVISDPKLYFNSQIKIKNFYADVGNDFYGQTNNSPDDIEENLVHKIPRNSIICKLIDNGEAQFSNDKILCYPFFSPHFSLPIKPGEQVWILAETFYEITRFYWMNRKHGSYYNDNVNLTSHEREVSIYFETSLKSGISAFTDEEILNAHNFPKLSNTKHEEFLEPNTTFKKSDAYQKEFTNEPVPELVKKCGDLVLQGSNNTLIQLTTEKFTPLASVNARYSKNLFLPKDREIPEGIYRAPQSPAIDMCVARKKKHFTELAKKDKKIISTTTEEKNILSLIENNRDGLEGIENYEVNKFNEDFFTNRDLDPSNCGSRLYMSNNCDIDSIFKISDTEKSQEVFQQYGGATLAGYSEHIRLIAEGESSSFRVVKKHNEGETFLEIDNDGTVKIGSKEGNVNSEGGKSGMQPFVRGDDLEDILDELIIEVRGALNLIKEAFSTNVSPGLGQPNPVLKFVGDSMIGIFSDDNGSLNKIQNKLSNFKSTLIKGE